MTPLVLVAACGRAREVLEAVRAAEPDREVAVVDDDPARHGSRVLGAPVVGGLDDLRAFGHVEVVVCAGHGRVRRRLVERLLAIGVRSRQFVPIVHPGVHVPPSCRIGAGSVLLAGVVLTADVVVGDHVVVMPQVTLTHDDVLEDFATICAGVSLGGSVVVGSAAYVGMNASVREGLRVGPDATLGMGAVLLQDLPAGETHVGVPARPVRARRLQGV